MGVMGLSRYMNNFQQAATEMMLRHADTVPPHITAGMALVAFVGSVEVTPRPEYTDMLDTSWRAASQQAIDIAKQQVVYVTDETMDIIKNFKLERSPSEYNQLKLGVFRTVFRYLTTLQSDPAEAWVTKKDRRVVERAKVLASNLKT